LEQISKQKKIYDAFVIFWGTEKTLGTIDRANLNFPIGPGFLTKEGFIPLGFTTRKQGPQNVQGVLALAKPDRLENYGRLFNASLAIPKL